VLAAGIALVATVSSAVGPVWPASPLVEAPADAGDDSSLSLPFTIRNPSFVFPITNARLTCGIQEILATTGAGWFGATDLAYQFGNTDIRYGAPVPYGCNPLRLIHLSPDGSLKMRQQFATAATEMREPFKILKACVWIGIDYEIAGLWYREFNSIIFQWPDTPEGHRWVTGEALMESPANASPNERLFYHERCTNNAPSSRYVWFTSTGKPCLARGERRNACELIVNKMYDQTGHGRDLRYLQAPK
jgi:hypothetical protein